MFLNTDIYQWWISWIAYFHVVCGIILESLEYIFWVTGIHTTPVLFDENTYFGLLPPSNIGQVHLQWE